MGLNACAILIKHTSFYIVIPALRSASLRKLDK